MPYQELARLNKLIHEPARLSILTALLACNLAEFLFLQELTGLTKGNLSCHLSKLEQGNLVRIEKSFLRKKIPQTTIYLTPEGRAAIEGYWEKFDAIRKAIKK